MLEINPAALFVQIANFLILVFLLNKFLFKPIRAILAERALKFTGLSEAVEGFEARAMASERGILEGRDASKREGLVEKERLKTEAQEEERRLIDDAIGASDRTIREARGQVEASVASAREALESQVAALSQELATRILGRSAS